MILLPHSAKPFNLLTVRDGCTVAGGFGAAGRCCPACSGAVGLGTGRCSGLCEAAAAAAGRGKSLRCGVEQPVFILEPLTVPGCLSDIPVFIVEPPIVPGCLSD